MFLGLSIALIMAASALLLYSAWLINNHTRLCGLAAAVIWGMVAFGAAFALQETLLTFGVFDVVGVRLCAAPLVEEVLKALPLIVLALVARPSDTGSEPLYGFGMGIGFAALESVMYILSDPLNALGLAAGRMITVNIMHGISTALIGTASTQQRRGWRFFMRLGAALVVAVLGHALFNLLMITLVELRLPVALMMSSCGAVLLIILTRDDFAPCACTAKR